MDVDTALAEVPVNIMSLIDDTDFKSREVAVAYNAAGMDLVWNFVTTGGAYTQTAVTPTTAGNYDWAHQGDGMYSIAIPASGGASINNDTEGFGWFSGIATGVLPWRGPTIGFRAAQLNDVCVDSSDNLNVNVAEISDDTTAANNAELAFDGTGFGFTNCTVPTVTTTTTATTVTNEVTANVTKISGDSAAADKLEAMLDATESSTVNDAGASATVFITALTEASDDHYNGAVLVFYTGNLTKQARRISAYNGTSKTITVFPALTEAPANGDAFFITGRIEA